jgi:hypothetical protein
MAKLKIHIAKDRTAEYFTYTESAGRTTTRGVTWCGMKGLAGRRIADPYTANCKTCRRAFAASIVEAIREA